MAASSCTFPTPLTLPTPPVTVQACAVPLGGSNSTLLDTCCNGHINPIRTYSAPNSSDDCYMYCTTDDALSVQECLSEYMKEGAFQCFGVTVRRAGSGGKSTLGRGSWWMKFAIGVGVLGALGGLI